MYIHMYIVYNYTAHFDMSNYYTFHFRMRTALFLGPRMRQVSADTPLSKQFNGQDLSCWEPRNRCY